MKEKARKMAAAEARGTQKADTAAKKAATEKRLATMRKNLSLLEEKAEGILAKGDSMTAEDRLELLNIVNVAYHDSGKIEGIYSIDSTASCEFCSKMIRAAIDNILMICGACYAAADAWKEAAWRRHKLNARILSTVLFTVDELRALPVGLLCRYNEDGDTVNETMGRNYLRNAAAHPGTNFGYWYKNQPIVEKALHAEGIRTRDQLPKNIRFIHSSALIGFPVRPAWHDDAIFTVYPDAATTEAAILAGAHECNGRRCRACGFFCYLAERQPEAVHIAEVLRTNAARRKEIRAAYDRKLNQQAVA